MSETATPVKYEIVSAFVTDPAGSLFKSCRNDRAECKVVMCSNKDDCGLYARGECAMLAVLGATNCPYGKKTYEGGFTRKARNYARWINERKEKYKDVKAKLGTYKNVMAVIGDYVFVPYAHMNMNKALPVDHHGLFMSNGTHFVKREDFTPELVVNIASFRPQAMMGGEITSYQKEVVPDFLMHLKEQMPEIYNAAVELDPVIAKKTRTSNVGRKAYLHSLRPGVVVTKYHDTHKLSTQHWTWDGVYLTSTNTGLSFSIVDYTECEIRIKPKDNVVVDITSEDQVDANTKYAI